MIRFIDLRGQIMDDSDLPEEERSTDFAFYDTITDRFIAFGGNETWIDRSTWRADFRASGLEGGSWTEERFTSLMPDWVPEVSPSGCAP